jgi:uncharacterized membrane protein YhaH (DUF805 family)
MTPMTMIPATMTPVTMTWTRLLFDDEGEISRKAWWAGTGFLVFVHCVLEFLAGRLFAQSGLDRPFMLFVSLAILVPFYSVNAKRFRAIGRSSAFALIGGLLPGIVILSDIFLGVPSLDIALGLTLLGVMLWYILDLGVLEHSTTIDLSRLRV